MYLRDMFSILKKYGCCSWKNFPHFGTYAQVFKRYRKYADQLDQIAKKYRIDSYYAINVDSKEEIKRAVYSLGAVVISVPCYEGCGPDWTAEEVKKNGKWIPMKWPEISNYEEDPERRGGFDRIPCYDHHRMDFQRMDRREFLGRLGEKRGSCTAV
jgi:hypothetical protein